jgi:hypothetical protein
MEVVALATLTVIHITMSNPRISRSVLTNRYLHVSTTGYKATSDVKLVNRYLDTSKSYTTTLQAIMTALYKKPSLSINRMYAGCLHEMDNTRRCNCRNKHTALVLELMNIYLDYNYKLDNPVTFIQFYTANKRNKRYNFKLYDVIEIDACIKLCKLYPDLQRHTVYLPSYKG